MGLIAVAVAAFNLPPIATRFHPPNFTVETDQRADAIIVNNLFEIGLNFIATDQIGRPFGVGRKFIGIGMCGDVTGQAWIAIVAPRAADAIRLFINRDMLCPASLSLIAQRMPDIPAPMIAKCLSFGIAICYAIRSSNPAIIIICRKISALNYESRSGRCRLKRGLTGWNRSTRSCQLPAKYALGARYARYGRDGRPVPRGCAGRQGGQRAAGAAGLYGRNLRPPSPAHRTISAGISSNLTIPTMRMASSIQK